MFEKDTLCAWKISRNSLRKLKKTTTACPAPFDYSFANLFSLFLFLSLSSSLLPLLPSRRLNRISKQFITPTPRGASMRLSTIARCSLRTIASSSRACKEWTADTNSGALLSRVSISINATVYVHVLEMLYFNKVSIPLSTQYRISREYHLRNLNIFSPQVFDTLQYQLSLIIFEKTCFCYK